MENTKKTLYKEIQQAYYNATASQEKYTASDKSVTASKEAFNYAQERYNAGKSTVFEFNEAKTKYAQSLAEQAQAKYDFITKDHPELKPLTTVRKEYLETAFRVIDKEFGGIESYLINNLEADIEKLRNLYTE